MSELNNKNVFVQFKDKLVNFFKGRIAVAKKVPWWGWVSGAVLFGLQYGLYRLARLIIENTGGVSRSYIPNFGDNAIPLVPYFFVIIYLFSYVFWIMGPIAASLTSKKNFYNFLIGILTAYAIGFIIFCAFPTYMDRSTDPYLGPLLKNPENYGGFSWFLEKMIIGNDGNGANYNLFPSYHCLISLYCYFGVARQKEISKSFRIYSFIMVPLICLSTIFTKQHYWIDIIGGLGISAIVYLVICIVKPGDKIVAKQEKRKELENTKSNN